ncbi:Phosphoesterase, PA-phosphatase related [Nostoc sp. NIES-3756]|uniref:phosphatase PAP2 family protein n=1 Tax=Nostoc sp. NIES-3756 TaxID=1751286 RepID=UPI000722AC36|nr:phosphatase PAP2 family protein [Nostoc sp. NIES-3756]BAT52415.1 Phosphoesterase, PA-phosphatase related [Nostoc sp. NIES-3756]
MLLQRSLKSTSNDSSSHLSNSYSLIRAVHTAVKGRVRFKVNGLYRCEALKRYLEIRLSKLDIITQASANPVTSNVLIIFDPNFTLDAIASLLQAIVLDYRKVSVNLPTIAESATKPVHQPQLDKLIPCLATATIFASSAGLLFRYGLDESILLAVQKLHNPLLDRIMQSITFLGEPLPLLLISSGFGLQLWHNHRRRDATSLGIATVGAVGLNYLLKEMFGRARPALWDYIVHAVHYSFPSGHAMVSTAVYGYIGYILAKEFPQWREPILASTVTLILAIGFSRLYLGVHWPTDVLVGYAAGLLWLIACISISTSAQQQAIVGGEI